MMNSCYNVFGRLLEGLAVRFASIVFCAFALTFASAEEPLLEFIHTGFENASPLDWEIDGEGTIIGRLVYDHERSSPNRANGHWHFEIQAPEKSQWTVILENFDNVWNGKKGSPLCDRTACFVSNDGQQWRPIETEVIEGNRLRFNVKMEGNRLKVARLEPYRLSDLDRLIEKIESNPLVEIQKVGKTVAGRDLEIVRIGDPGATHRVLLRARSHPWEPGGNWVVEGLIERLLRGDTDAKRYLSQYCVYVLPIANKDGVARGMTRFNLLGKDLNRNWDRPADPELAPENRALETWIESMIARGQRPDLAIDFHNDNNGRLHISRPNIELAEYLKRMKRFELLLREHTWFTEGSTGGNFHNPGSFGEGLLERYRITAFIHELNADWIAALDDYPSAKNWKLYGSQLCDVFYEYFEGNSSE